MRTDEEKESGNRLTVSKSEMHERCKGAHTQRDPGFDRISATVKMQENLQNALLCPGSKVANQIVLIPRQKVGREIEYVCFLAWRFALSESGWTTSVLSGPHVPNASQQKTQFRFEHRLKRLIFLFQNTMQD